MKESTARLLIVDRFSPASLLAAHKNVASAQATISI